jgi:hypothetical protein
MKKIVLCLLVICALYPGCSKSDAVNSSNSDAESNSETRKQKNAQPKGNTSDLPSDSKLIDLSIPGIYGGHSPGQSPHKMIEGKVIDKTVDGDIATVKFRSRFRTQGCSLYAAHGIFKGGRFCNNEFSKEYTLRYRRSGSSWVFDAILDS